MTEVGTYVSPEMSPETIPFWEAANQDRLVIHTCLECGKSHHYPRAMCPHCYSDNLEWRESDGFGTIYAFSVVLQRDGSRYTLAYVEIAPGVKAMTNIVDCDPDRLAVGQKVKAVFRPSRSGQKILLFTPAS